MTQGGRWGGGREGDGEEGREEDKEGVDGTMNEATENCHLVPCLRFPSIKAGPFLTMSLMMM